MSDLSRDENWHQITAIVGPILKAAFPKERSITRLQVAQAIASALTPSPNNSEDHP